MSFLEDVYAASTPRTTKADVVAYFKPMGKGWQAKLVRALFPFTSVKNPHNLERRFNPDRIGHAPRTAREKKEFADFGATLPPIPPAGGYHVYGTVWVKYSDECVDREVDEIIDGKAADALAKMAGEEMLKALINQYQTGDIEGGGPSSCAEPELTVDPIEEELEDFLPTLRRGPVK